MIKFPNSPNESLSPEFLACIRRALAEDIGAGDVTTNAIVPQEAMMKGQIIAKQAGIGAGLDVAAAVYRVLDERVRFESLYPGGGAGGQPPDAGEGIRPGPRLLTGERTALNFLGRMSGIATLTRQFVDAVAGTKAVILDTRKTAPGLRALDKLAVRRGGGQNHRVGLYDMILIKDNHIDFAGSLEAAVERARAAGGGLEIEVETRTLEDVERALAIGVRTHLAGQYVARDDARGGRADRRAGEAGSFGQRDPRQRPPGRRNRRGFYLDRGADPFGESVRCQFFICGLRGSDDCR